MSYRSKDFNLTALRRASQTARQAICDKCVRGMVHPPEDPRAYAWGQYLEIRGKPNQQGLDDQYGIYGTSAALQVLAMQHKESYRELILWGSRVLPLVQKDSENRYNRLHEKFAFKGDLVTVYKLCSLLDATTVLESLSGTEDFDIDHAGILRNLLAARLPGAGWPDFKPGSEDWQPANTHATAVALLAISKCGLSPEAESACREALLWFFGQPLEKQSIATLSMLCMAYVNLAQNGDRGKQFMEGRLDRLRKQCEVLIMEWVRTSFPGEVQRSLEGVEYWVPPVATRSRSAGRDKFTFLLYLPHVLAASAVLTTPTLRQRFACRQYVLGVVGKVTAELNNQGCFIAAGRNMVSTVEHLWLYRLLDDFERESLYPKRIYLFLDHLRCYATRRWPLMASAVILTVAIGVVAALAHGGVQVALGVVSAIVLTIVTNIITALLMRRGEA